MYAPNKCISIYDYVEGYFGDAEFTEKEYNECVADYMFICSSYNNIICGAVTGSIDQDDLVPEPTLVLCKEQGPEFKHSYVFEPCFFCRLLAELKDYPGIGYVHLSVTGILSFRKEPDKLQFEHE